MAETATYNNFQARGEQIAARNLAQDKQESRSSGEKVGGAMKAGGTTMQASGATMQASGKGMNVIGKGAQGVGKGVKAGGQAMMRTGAALSSTGLGAVAGVPLAIAGGLTYGAGTAADVAGKGVSKAGESVDHAGRKVRKTGGAVKKSGKKVSTGAQLNAQKMAEKALKKVPAIAAADKIGKMVGIDVMKIFKWMMIINITLFIAYYVFVTLVIAYTLTHTWEILKSFFGIA